MDDFEGIIAFVAVAECGGFSSAAKRLACSTSHVSRQVAALEARINAALLVRTTRQVSLTDSGERYYHHCKELVDGLQLANEEITSQQVTLSGVLRVSLAGGFAENYVAPTLVTFAKQHPELRVSLDFNSRVVNFVEEGIDFSIRYGELSDSNLVARRLVKRPMIAAASLEYLATYGTPKHPTDLKQHKCIVTVNDQWRFEYAGQLEVIRVNNTWRSNNSNVALEACEQGLGIAYMPRSSFKEAIRDGKVQPILEPYWSRGSNTWIVYPNRRFMPLRARMAINFLLQHFADWDE